jgi:hypothetical protein
LTSSTSSCTTRQIVLAVVLSQVDTACRFIAVIDPEHAPACVFDKDASGNGCPPPSHRIATAHLLEDTIEALSSDAATALAWMDLTAPGHGMTLPELEAMFAGLMISADGTPYEEAVADMGLHLIPPPDPTTDCGEEAA